MLKKANPLTRTTSKQPLYLQLATIFRRRIECSLWPCGEQTPTIEALMVEFGVGRATVRSAFAELEAEGLLVSSRGRGTFIKQPPGAQAPRYAIGQTWPELVARGNLNELAVSSETTDVQLELPAWCVNEGHVAGRYCRLERVYMREQVRVCFSDVFLEQSLFERIEADIQHQSIVAALGQQQPGEIASGHQTITIVAAGEDTASRLQISIGSPVAEITRRLYDYDGVLVYWARIHYDSRYMRLDFDLFKPPAKAR